MNKSIKKLAAVVMSVLLAVSSFASVNAKIVPPAPHSGVDPVLTNSPVLAKRVSLSSTELAKYRRLANQSQALAIGEAAGASDTTKTVLIVVGVVVVVVGVAALVAAHEPVLDGPLFPKS